MFKKVVIPGTFLDDGTFAFYDFNTVIVDVPSEFRNASWGYGRWYGRFYGHT